MRRTMHTVKHFGGATFTLCPSSHRCRGAHMQRLKENLKAYDTVCELSKSPVLSPGTQFYLAQLREVLRNEIAELQREADEALSA